MINQYSTNIGKTLFSRKYFIVLFYSILFYRYEWYPLTIGIIIKNEYIETKQSITPSFLSTYVVSIFITR